MASNCCSVMGGVLALVGVSAIVGGVHSMFVPVVVNLDQDGVDPTESEPDAPPNTPSYEVGVEAIYEHVENLGVVLDARSLYDYEQGHIPGAMWMPTSRIDSNAALLFDIEYEAGGFDQPVFIYCGGGDCDASHNVAIRLEQAGFTNWKIFVEGYPAWVAAGHPVDQGAPLEVDP